MYGYSPLGACYCEQQGELRTVPNATGPLGYPREGLDASYSGLCAFDCRRNYCPEEACATVPAPLTTPTVSNFLPPACVSGTGEGGLAGLCSFACNLGHCPISACTCTAQGALHTLPEPTGDIGVAAPGLDETIYTDLCAFTCMYGYCPEGACVKAGDSGQGDQSGSGDVYIDPILFLEPSPVVGCIPPCNIIFPELILPTPTTIHLYPVPTPVVAADSTIRALQPSPITTSTIDYFNMPISSGQTNPFSFYMTPSYSASPVVITAGGSTTTIDLPPASVQSTPTGSHATQAFFTLHTTEYVTDGRSYTYSKAQFPSLTEQPSPTVTTTTFTPPRNTDASSTNSNTPVTVWVQSGGFYWSPVPKPTANPADVPPLPSFPPVPSAKCFELGDLFSIDCPPDRSNPTTTWSSHVPISTCTDVKSPGCGHPDSSTSETECSTHTATSYWVSCSDTSCTTTKTATFSGCSVTDSTTTTGNYCPTGVLIDPEAGQGQDGYGPKSTTAVTTTIPEIAIVGGQPYAVSQGSITANGATYEIPNVGGSGQVSTTIDGVPMAIIPSYSGTINMPVMPTVKPTGVSSSGSGGSSGSETTTTPVGPAPSNGPYAGAISISYYENTHTGSGEWDLYEFYSNDINVGGCPEIAGPDYVKTDGAYAGMTDGTGGFKAFGATCRYEGQNVPTNSWDQKEVGKFVCDKYRSAICYERSGGGTCAHGWQVTSRVLQCEW